MVVPPNSSLGKRKILVAEDVELNQQLARHMLEAWGFEVDIAVNGKEALLLVQQNSYDLVLMDIQMPEMDGMEATRQIRLLKDAVKAGIPIVALTANALQGDRERFLAAGMNDYLSKPFTEPNLFQIIALNLTNVTTNYYAPVLEMPEPATQATVKLYNLAMVNSIASGDDGFVKRMLQLFLDTIPPSLEDMQRETALQHWEQVGKLAHKLKSTIDSMGIVSLKETIRQIENNGKKGAATDLIPDQVNEVEAVLQQCMEQVRYDFFA
jgi:CheY-like chemotaxis protein